MILESLLYEACGRIIDPVHGSAGMLSSGHWPQCQAAVAAVLRGSPLVIPSSGEDDDSSSADDEHSVKSVQGSDIRQLPKHESSAAPVASLYRAKTRPRFECSAKSHVDPIVADICNDSETKFTITGWDHGKKFDDEVERASSLDSVLSVQTVEPDLVIRNEPVRELKPIPSSDNETGPDLTLSLNAL